MYVHDVEFRKANIFAHNALIPYNLPTMHYEFAYPVLMLKTLNHSRSVRLQTNYKNVFPRIRVLINFNYRFNVKREK